MAVSTPPGRSPRGMVRLSGPGVNQILAALLEGAEEELPRAGALTAARLRIAPRGMIAAVVDARRSAEAAPEPSPYSGGGRGQGEGSFAGSAQDSQRALPLAPPATGRDGEGVGRGEDLHAPHVQAEPPSHADTPTPPPPAPGKTGRGQNQPPALPCLLARFAAPRSYTGQDMAEVQVPGNPALLERVVHQVVALGARLAEPGEFTFRAFLANKLDLTQAEGVAATIAATSDAQLAAAGLLREGELGRFASSLVEELAQALALVEAGIDFVDQDDVVPIAPRQLDERLEAIERRLTELLRRSRSWGALEALPRVVLAGPPSSGKSTLFNALLGRQRAVIAAAPGTTRDALEEPLSLELEDGRRMEVMLVDLAGLDEPATALHAEAQAAARRAIERADLVLRIDDGRAPPAHAPPSADVPSMRGALEPSSSGRGQGEGCSLQPATRNAQPATEKSPHPNPLPKGEGVKEDPHPGPLPQKGEGAGAIRVRTKADLGDPPAPDAPHDVAVSARTGAGLDRLRRLIAQRVGTRGVALSSELLALQPRHEAALRAAAESLSQARALLAPQREAPSIEQVELVAGALRHALDELAALGGRMSPDDVIGRVFATFCVGK